MTGFVFVTLTPGEAMDIDDLTPPPDRSDATMLFTYRSPTLAEIARPLLKESINLYGEAFMRLNTEKGLFPTNDAALEGLPAGLAGLSIMTPFWRSAIDRSSTGASGARSGPTGRQRGGARSTAPR